MRCRLLLVTLSKIGACGAPCHHSHLFTRPLAMRSATASETVVRVSWVMRATSARLTLLR